MQRILIAGEGGQGVQLIAEILAKAAFKEGKSASYIPNFGVEQRGGVSLAFIVIDEKSIPYPKFEIADILIPMSSRARDRIKGCRNKSTIYIDAAGLDIKDLPKKVHNIFILGILLKTLKSVKEETVLDVLDDKMKTKYDKNPELRLNNITALRKGFEQ